MSHLHTNDIDVAAIVSPSQEPQRRFVAPAISATPCRTPRCRNVIRHVGDVVVSTCDDCLDVLAGDVEVRLRPRSDLAEYSWSGDSVPVVTSEAEDEAVDFGFARAPQRLRDEIFSADAVKAEQSCEATPRHVVDAPATICASCSNVTERVCKCGRLCCHDCMDADWLCPNCDDEEA